MSAFTTVKLYGISEAARELGLSAEWLREGGKRGSLPKAKRGRNGYRVYTEEDILDEYAPEMVRLLSKWWRRAREESRDNEPGEAEERKPTQAELLIRCADDAQFFHTPEGDAYAKRRIGDHSETHPVRSKGFRRWVVRVFQEARPTAWSPSAPRRPRSFGSSGPVRWSASEERSGSKGTRLKTLTKKVPTKDLQSRHDRQPIEDTLQNRRKAADDADRRTDDADSPHTKQRQHESPANKRVTDSSDDADVDTQSGSKQGHWPSDPMRHYDLWEEERHNEEQED